MHQSHQPGSSQPHWLYPFWAWSEAAKPGIFEVRSTAWAIHWPLVLQVATLTSLALSLEKPQEWLLSLLVLSRWSCQPVSLSFQVELTVVSFVELQAIATKALFRTGFWLVFIAKLWLDAHWLILLWKLMQCSMTWVAVRCAADDRWTYLPSLTNQAARSCQSFSWKVELGRSRMACQRE